MCIYILYIYNFIYICKYIYVKITKFVSKSLSPMFSRSFMVSALYI